MSVKRIDLHVHLAGTGSGGTGCHVSPRMARSLQFKAMQVLAGRAGMATDQQFADRLVEYADSAQTIDYACLFAMDGVYDAHGELRPDLSHLMVPNAYVVEVAKRSPRTLPVISINPQRRDALAELEKWAPSAVALKWLPPMQEFDPSSPRYDEFRKLLARLELPVICHAGTEHTFPGAKQRLGDPGLCEPLLALGVPVVFAHCATCTIFDPLVNYLPTFERLLDKYEHVYGDTAGFCSLVRWRNVRRFSVERYIGRVLHGSDFPVPTSALYFWRQLGGTRVRNLGKIANPLDRDAAIKRAAGMPESVFTGAYNLLEPRIRRIKGSA